MILRVIRLNDKLRKRPYRPFHGKASIVERLKKLRTGQCLVIRFIKGKDHDEHTVRALAYNWGRELGFRVAARISNRTLYLWRVD